MQNNTQHFNLYLPNQAIFLNYIFRQIKNETCGRLIQNFRILLL